jgi:glucan-binding repeat-containing protein
MKLKNLISAACLAMGLAFAMPAAASLQMGSPAIVQAAEGWQQSGTSWSYWKDNQKVTGLQTINGSQYYFDANGNRVTGTVTIDGVMYYFKSGTGELCTNMTGLARIGTTNTYYYFKSKADGSIAVSQWVTHNQKKYYVGSNGKVMFGTVRINNKLYHLTANGLLTGYAKSSYNNKYYYASAKGVLKTGLCKINGKYYYFNPSNGVRKTGLCTIGDNTYYFSTKTGAATTGWLKLKGKYYYFDKKGRRLTGIQQINNRMYYLNPNDDGARATNCWYKHSSGKIYYFGPNGITLKGFFKATDGKTYYSASNGARQTGWITSGGKKYYFSKATGAMQTGWLTYNGKTYYLNSSTSSSSYGAAVTGWAKINGSTYYFNSDGTLKKGSWIYDSGSQASYYLDASTGKVLTGRQKIDGTWYDLGTTGAYKASTIANPTSSTYVIKVNRVMNCITVYRGNTPVKAFVCSTAKDGVSTPLGEYTILDKLRWHELNGPSWGQYCSHITSNILFHSVPNTKYNNNHSLEWWEFNKLGTAASAGCIRMTVADAKWIYDNCPVGTKVIIYDDATSAGPLGKPTAPTIPAGQNYDPTDPYA